MSCLLKYILNNFPFEDFIIDLSLLEENKFNINVQKKIISNFNSNNFNFSLSEFISYCFKNKIIDKNIYAKLNKDFYNLNKNIEFTILIFLLTSLERGSIINNSISKLFGDFCNTYTLFLHTNKGTGGDESEYFLKEYINAYSKTLNIFNLNKNQLNGYFLKNIKYDNFCIFYMMLFEGPIIRVQREPFNTKGKIHTSTIVFMPFILSLPNDKEEIIRHLSKESMVTIETFRCGGAGGQHVNKTDSAVRIRHNILDIVIISRDERSQIANKKSGMQRLTELIRQNLGDNISDSINKHFINAGRNMKTQTFNYKRNSIFYHENGMLISCDIFFNNNLSFFKKCWDKQLNFFCGIT